MKTPVVLALAVLVLAAARALPADTTVRPDEGSLFGASPDAALSSPPALGSSAQAGPGPSGASGLARGVQPQPASRGADTDLGGLSQSTLGHDDFANGSVKDDDLQIGGVVYQEWFMDEASNQAPGSASMSMPLQVDTYLDMRPNDRVRGYIDARLIYDPTRNAQGDPTGSGAALSSQIAGTSAAAVSGTANPVVVLDQAWLNFDVDRKAFVTVGKQHVKWGTGHIWNPTDFLTVQKLNPLQPYDLRLGDTMLKVQAPVQGMDGTNLYAIALLDNPQAASSVQQTGGAFRVETLVLGTAEVGVEAVTRANQYPAYGADFSAPVGPIDVYAENALVSGGYPDYVFKGAPAPGGQLTSVYGVNQVPGPADQTVVGASYDFAWKENRQATVGGEYFYNALGLSQGAAKLLPIMIYEGNYTPFYMGRNYAAVYLSAEGPDAFKKTNYNLSNIANFSDGSAVSRLDFNWLLLDYLTYGAWVAVHYGTPGGELNFALDTPALSNGAQRIPAVNVPATPLELGMSLRLLY